MIMSGVFGIEGRPAPRIAEHRMRQTIRRLSWALDHARSTSWSSFSNVGRREPRGVLRQLLGDRRPPAVRGDPRAPRRGRRRRAAPTSCRCCSQARDEDGEPLTDQELRDELLSLVLAGHETTANSLAWTFERLLRTPPAYDRLRELTRGAEGPRPTPTSRRRSTRAMRNRPVIPMIVGWSSGPGGSASTCVPARHPGGGQHRRPAPPRGRLPRARSPSAPSGSWAQQARDLHVDPVRRRHPPLPRRVAGDGRAARGADGDRPAHRPGRARPRARAGPRSAT